MALEAGGWEIVKKYVELGMGISIVNGACLTENDSLKKIPLGEYFPKRGYGVIIREGKFITPQAKIFIDMMDPDFFKTEEEVSV